jgi:hypothetical protein
LPVVSELVVVVVFEDEHVSGARPVDGGRNEDAVIPKEQSPGIATTRRYSAQEKAAAVREGAGLRRRLGTDQGTVNRVADQLGFGKESVRAW